MFNKKRIAIFGVFFLFMFMFITFAGGTPQNQAIATRNVTFIDGYNNEEISTQRIIVGEDAEIPANPNHTGYIFLGWYEYENQNIKIENFTNVVENIRVIAKYAADRNNNGIADENESSYIVTFIDSIDGTIISRQTILTGTDATAPAVPTHENFRFVGWSTSYTNITRDTTVNTVYTSVLEIPTEEERYYNVTFIDGETDEIIEIVSVREGLTATTPTPREYDKKLFVRWEGNYTNVTSDRTVRSIYVDDRNNNGVDDITEEKYTVTFKTPKTGKITSGKIKYEGLLLGQNYKELNLTSPVVEPINEHYTFEGFIDELNNKFDENGKVTGNIDYTAVLTPDQDQDGDGLADADDTFEVTINVINGSVTPNKTLEIKYNEKATFTVTPNEKYTTNNAVVTGNCVLNGNTLTTNNIKTNTTCTVEFKLDEDENGIADEFQTDVTLNVTNGTPVSTTKTTEFNKTVEFEITPNSGYNLNDFSSDCATLIDGKFIVTANSDKTEKICNITLNKNKYKVEINSINGKVENPVKTIEHGNDVEFLLTPDTKYTTNHALIENCENATVENGKLTITNITKDIVCNITFAKDEDKNGIADEYQTAVTLILTNGKTLDGKTTETKIIEKGTEAIFEITSNDNEYYKLNDYRVNNIENCDPTSVSYKDGKYHIKATDKNEKTCGITINPTKYNANLQISQDGQITDKGTFEVIAGVGEPKAEKIEGYTPDKDNFLTCETNGEKYDIEITYFYDYIDSPQIKNIDVTAKKIKENSICTLNYLKDEDGNNVPDEDEVTATLIVNNGTVVKNNIKVLKNGIASFKVLANENYNIDNYTVKEGCIVTKEGNTFTFQVENENKTCEITLNKYKYNVTVTGTNGTITNGTTTAEHGENITFELKPNEKYTTNNAVITGCSNAEINNSALTITNITNDTVCNVEFQKDENENNIADDKEITLTFNYMTQNGLPETSEIIIEKGTALNKNYFTPGGYITTSHEYEFINWKATINEKEVTITKETIIDENTVINANYDNGVLRKFNVNFFTHKDEIISENKDIEYGTSTDEINKPTPEERENYTFTGWKNQNGTDLNDLKTITEDTNFKATYKANITSLIVKSKKAELTYKVGTDESVLKNDLEVYTVDFEGKISETPLKNDEYNTNFISDSAIEDGKELIITFINEAGKEITNNTHTYNITEGEVYLSDFDITYIPNNREYKRTVRKLLGVTHICVNALAWDCDKGSRVTTEKVDFEFFELTQHISSYGIEINSVTANYDSGESVELIGYTERERWYMHRIINNRYFESTYIIRKEDGSNFTTNGEGQLSTITVKYTNTRTNRNYEIKFRYYPNETEKFKAEK